MTRKQTCFMIRATFEGGVEMKSLAIAALALLAATPAQTQQGVSPTEIVIGTAQDLSGPIVNFSKATVNGMRMRVDEINAAGGIQRSEEHTSELQSPCNLVCRLLLEKKKNIQYHDIVAYRSHYSI